MSLHDQLIKVSAMHNAKRSAPTGVLSGNCRGPVIGGVLLALLASIMPAIVSAQSDRDAFELKQRAGGKESGLALECVGAKAFMAAASCATHAYVRPAPGDFVAGYPSMGPADFADPNFGYYRWPMPAGYGAVVCGAPIMPNVEFTGVNPCERVFQWLVPASSVLSASGTTGGSSGGSGSSSSFRRSGGRSSR